MDSATCPAPITDYKKFLAEYMAEAKVQEDKYFAENRERLQAKYKRELTYEQVHAIHNYERACDLHQNSCKFCDGTRCWRGDPFPKIPKLAPDLLSHEMVTCPVYLQIQIKSKLKSARIPERYIGKTLDDYDADRFNQRAIEYAEESLNVRHGAYFYGSFGTGKTFLAAIIAQQWLRAKKSVIFIKVPCLLSDIRSTFNDSEKKKVTEQDILKEIFRADLLVLDDFGMEKPSKFTGTTLCNIIDQRYDREVPTIITSNNSPQEAAQELNNAKDGANINGSRILDRIIESMKIIKFGGGSRRMSLE